MSAARVCVNARVSERRCWLSASLALGQEVFFSWHLDFPTSVWGFFFWFSGFSTEAWFFRLSQYLHSASVPSLRSIHCGSHGWPYWRRAWWRREWDTWWGGVGSWTSPQGGCLTIGEGAHRGEGGSRPLARNHENFMGVSKLHWGSPRRFKPLPVQVLNHERQGLGAEVRAVVLRSAHACA